MTTGRRCVHAVIGVLALAASAGAQTAMYHLEAEPDRAPTSRFSATEIGVLEKLNRADREHLARLPVLVVPDRWFHDERAFSPFPRRYDAAAALPTALVVHVPAQAFGAYEFGNLVRWGPISSGAEESPTPAGLYHLNWRSAGRASTVNPDWFLRWYFNFENEQGRAFHLFDLPGHPASHGCIRLLERDAQWLFGWGREWRLDARGVNVLEAGTPVLIVGAFEFGAPPPWRSPAWLRQPIELPESPFGR